MLNRKAIVSIMLTPLSIIFFSIIAFGFVMYYIDDVKHNVFYNPVLECNLISEQRVACYSGCKFTQYNYTDCTSYCENKYYVEYNDDGNINSCEYNKT